MESCNDSLNTFSIILENVSKEFNHRSVIKDISLQLHTPSSLAITGKNGAGKSTLSKIIASLLSITKGKISYLYNGISIDEEKYKPHVGFIAPYLNFYDEFTAIENLSILSNIRINNSFNHDIFKEILHNVNLWNRRNDLVGTYSSGMKQRLKYAFALVHQPKVLIVDEPTTNLDEEGVEFVQRVVIEQKKRGILIIATNNKNEAQWCNEELCLDR